MTATLLHKRLIIGITGASGAVYGIRLLQVLRDAGVETHLVLSRAGALTIRYETDMTVSEVRALAHRSYPVNDPGAACASGSFRADGMIVAPCSVKTLGEIATGVTSTLLSRSADVTLKERRRLVLMLRETPLNENHLQNMLSVTRMGGIIAPPVPAFYVRPRSLDEIVEHALGRVLDLFGVEAGLVQRWGEGETPAV